MISSLKGMMLTLSTFFRPVVTHEYPKKHKPIEKRFMGFPGLTWDFSADEAYCTGCMVCIRECPTQCMSAVMKDNPKFETGESHRKKIIDTFEVNLNRCIVCGICVEVCNLDAIVMTYEHEISTYGRNDDRVDLDALLKLGTEHQLDVEWQPIAPQRNHFAAVQAAREARSAGTGDAQESSGDVDSPARRAAPRAARQAPARDDVESEASTEGEEGEKETTQEG